MSLIKHILKESSSIPIIHNLKEYAYEILEETGGQGFNTIDDVKEFIENELIPEIESYYKEKRFTIYRVIGIEDINDVDENNLGYHYTVHKENLWDSSFYNSIGLDITDDFIYVVFKIEIKFDDVDWYSTIDSRLNFPREGEINLKPSMSPPKIKDKFIIKGGEIT